MSLYSLCGSHAGTTCECSRDPDTHNNLVCYEESTMLATYLSTIINNLYIILFFDYRQNVVVYRMNRDCTRDSYYNKYL